MTGQRTLEAKMRPGILSALAVPTLEGSAVMKRARFVCLLLILRIGCVFAGFLSLALSMSAQFTTLASFNNSNGASPSSLVQGSDGNFYGTTTQGGANGGGTVFQMTPAGVLTTLYSFCVQSGCTDGETPESLMQASDGNFYGTTAAGGANGGGTVFQITPAGVLATLYSFCSQTGCSDGRLPWAALVQASNGNFYGTTQQGGVNATQCSGYGCGTIFQITPAGVFTTLYSFCSQSGCGDGADPMGALVQFSNGNFYGTTYTAGMGNAGTIFEITPAGQLTTLFSGCVPNCTYGANPQTGLVIGSQDFYGTGENLYGATNAGGGNGVGMIFEITPAGALYGIYTFCPQYAGCIDPSEGPVGLVAATNGQLYGIDIENGEPAGTCVYCGTLFQESPESGFTTLHNFCSISTGGNCADGNDPTSLIQAANGNLYGTTAQGGANNYGTIFSFPAGILLDLYFSPNPAIQGQPVTVTAFLPPTATGTVTFTYGSTTMCNAVPVIQGYGANGPNQQADCVYSALPAGTDVITATYSGDANFGASSTSGALDVLVPTTTVLTSLVNPTIFDQPITLNVTTTGQSGGTPTGSYFIYDNGTGIASGTILGGGQGTFVFGSMPLGANSLTAVYSGDATFAPSTSNVLIQIVNLPPPVTLQANIAGSTAFWLEAGEAAYTLGGTTTTCAWTSSPAVDGYSFVIDQRVPGNPGYVPSSIDHGALWVTWTPGTAGGTCAAPDNTSQVWAYIGLDSVVGNRCFFAQPQCTLNVGTINQGVITPLSPGTPGANALPGITDTPLPASVLATFNGQTISMAATDILPADARFASYSILSPCGSLGSGTQFNGLGYGPGPFAPNPIDSYFYSYFSGYPTNVNDFNVYGTDPATGNPIPAYSITPVGAIPVIVTVNTSNSNGFGSAQIANLNRADLGLLFTNLFLRTADAIVQPFAGTGATYSGVSALIPSPLSGSYNIFEHSITNSKELYRSLDLNNCAPDFVVIANPLTSTRNIGSNTAYRYRVIGTNQMLSELQSTQDSIGFELWSAENFAGTSNLKYVSVDGIDPLFNTYSNGTIPQSGNGLLPNVTLSHVADGSYPIWNEERLISSPSNAGVAATFAAYTQAQLSFGAGATRPDFIPDSQLNVFHMHFAPFGVTFNATNTASDGPKVCGAGSAPEDGGDVGGLVLGLQAGADFCVLQDNYGAPNGTGPTDIAPFGVRQ
jgi:uncharacterized repeat protein (TIGR03803 family)